MADFDIMDQIDIPSGFEEIGGSSNPDSDIWDFDKNKVLQGLLVDKRSGVGSHKSCIYTIETDDHKVHSVWGSKVLDERMDPINIGDEVIIAFDGMGKGASGSTYKKYRVYHKK